MSLSTELSTRVRPNSEAAPWVCDEIKRLEDERDAAMFQQDLAVRLLRIARAYVYERHLRGNETDVPARPGFVSYDLERIDAFLAEFPESK